MKLNKFIIITVALILLSNAYAQLFDVLNGNSKNKPIEQSKIDNNNLNKEKNSLFQKFLSKK